MSSRGSDYVFLSRHDLGEQTGTIDARTIEKSSIIAYEGAGMEIRSESVPGFRTGLERGQLQPMPDRQQMTSYAMFLD